jgi:predicted metal-dependent phosphoesterase TrpH
VAVTDHNTIAGAREANAAAPDLVIIGEEVRSRDGEIIGIFLSEPVPPDLPALETARRIRAQGGAVYLPHPLDPNRFGLQRRALVELLAMELVDAFEVHNAACRNPRSNPEAAALARELGLPGVAGSDAHTPAHLGRAITLLEEFDDAAGFRAALATARMEIAG